MTLSNNVAGVDVFFYSTGNMTAIITTVLGGLLALSACVVLFRVYLSPLRHVPGPGFAAITRFWYVWRLLKGKINLDIVAAHDRYGTDAMSSYLHPFD